MKPSEVRKIKAPYYKLIICKEDFFTSIICQHPDIISLKFEEGKKYYCAYTCIRRNMIYNYYIYDYQDFIDKQDNSSQGAICIWHLSDSFDIILFFEHFCTEQQYRNLKLKKLNEKMSI